MSSTVKCINGFFIICTILISIKTAHADPFITKSNILKNVGIKIFVGENQKKAIVFHDSDIENIKDSNLYVLNSKGPYSLKGKLEKMDLLNECGDAIPGIGFKKKGHDGFLIATGKDIGKIIKFYPGHSKSLSNIKSCFKELIKEQKKVSVYTANILNGNIEQIRWNRNLNADEIEKQCDELAKWNVKIDNKKSYKKLYEDCINGERYCKDEERVVINLHEKNGKCLQVTNSAIDCEGKATLGVDLREFLGILKIEYKSKKEVWLLWNAPGYEGDGIYAIEINDISNKNRLLEEWLVYNGC